MLRIFFLAVIVGLALAFNACSQTDFFWSFNVPFRSVEFENADAARVFGVGETGRAYLFYTTNGPSDAEISEAFFLDISLSGNGVVEFTSAETGDYCVEFCGVEFLGTRWNATHGGVFGETGIVTADFVDELHAVRGTGVTNLWGLVDATTLIDTLFCDHGHLNSLGLDVDAFYVAFVEFDTIAPGSVDLQTIIGSGGIWNEGEQVKDLIFGGATITVVLFGDVNLDGVVNLIDVAPFIKRLTNGDFQAEADINQDGVVDLLDVGPFVALLTGG